MSDPRWWTGLSLILVLLLPVQAERMRSGPTLVPLEELVEEWKSAPMENRERQDRLQALYLQARAKPEQIVLQPVPLPGPVRPQPPTAEDASADPDPLHNVICTKPGKTEQVIVVGGHLDKVPAGRGIIDDWSGSCLATNLFQSLHTVETNHTFVFIGFAHEERGLYGSKAYVASLDDEQKGRIKAMVNLECLGVDDAFLWTNGSTDRLEALAHKVADEYKLPLKDHVLNGVGADSIPFDRAGIPTITFDGLSREKFRLIHSDEDRFENVDPECYQRTYRLVLQFLLALDQGVPEPEPEPESRSTPKPDPAREIPPR